MELKIFIRLAGREDRDQPAPFFIDSNVKWTAVKHLLSSYYGEVCPDDLDVRYWDDEDYVIISSQEELEEAFRLAKDNNYLHLYVRLMEDRHVPDSRSEANSARSTIPVEHMGEPTEGNSLRKSSTAGSARSDILEPEIPKFHSRPVENFTMVGGVDTPVDMTMPKPSADPGVESSTGCSSSAKAQLLDFLLKKDAGQMAGLTEEVAAQLGTSVCQDMDQMNRFVADTVALSGQQEARGEAETVGPEDMREMIEQMLESEERERSMLPGALSGANVFAIEMPEMEHQGTESAEPAEIAETGEVSAKSSRDAETGFWMQPQRQTSTAQVQTEERRMSTAVTAKERASYEQQHKKPVRRSSRLESQKKKKKHHEEESFTEDSLDHYAFKREAKPPSTSTNSSSGLETVSEVTSSEAPPQPLPRKHERRSSKSEGKKKKQFSELLTEDAFYRYMEKFESHMKKDMAKEVAKKTAKNVLKNMPKASESKNVGSVHQDIICDFCHREIVGARYICGNCANYDLCEDCEDIQPSIHDSNHVFIKLRRPWLKASTHHGKRVALLRRLVYDPDQEVERSVNPERIQALRQLSKTQEEDKMRRLSLNINSKTPEEAKMRRLSLNNNNNEESEEESDELLAEDDPYWEVMERDFMTEIRRDFLAQKARKVADYSEDATTMEQLHEEVGNPIRAFPAASHNTARDTVYFEGDPSDHRAAALIGLPLKANPSDFAAKPLDLDVKRLECRLKSAAQEHSNSGVEEDGEGDSPSHASCPAEDQAQAGYEGADLMDIENRLWATATEAWKLAQSAEPQMFSDIFPAKEIDDFVVFEKPPPGDVELETPGGNDQLPSGAVEVDILGCNAIPSAVEPTEDSPAARGDTTARDSSPMGPPLDEGKEDQKAEEEDDASSFSSLTDESSSDEDFEVIVPDCFDISKPLDPHALPRLTQEKADRLMRRANKAEEKSTASNCPSEADHKLPLLETSSEASTNQERAESANDTAQNNAEPVNASASTKDEEDNNTEEVEVAENESTASVDTSTESNGIETCASSDPTSETQDACAEDVNQEDLDDCGDDDDNDDETDVKHPPQEEGAAAADCGPLDPNEQLNQMMSKTWQKASSGLQTLLQTGKDIFRTLQADSYEYKPADYKLPENDYKLPESTWQPPKDYVPPKSNFQMPSSEYQMPRSSYTGPQTQVSVGVGGEFAGPLQRIREMGFFNNERTLALLRLHGGDIERVVDALFEDADNNWADRRHGNQS